jgi:hypothetical protein
MEHEYAELRRLTRTRLGLIWELAKAGGELDDEDARFVEVLKQHPEYYNIWERAGSLGAEEVTQDGVNPFGHVTTDHVVENQLAEKGPPRTAETLDALPQAGYSRHDAIHAIGAIVAEEMFEIMRDDRPFNEAKYVKALRKLAREAKRHPSRRLRRQEQRKRRRRMRR